MLKVTDIKIKDGVYNPCGLPHILQKDNTAQTSYITLCDEVINLEVTLYILYLTNMMSL